MVGARHCNAGPGGLPRAGRRAPARRDGRACQPGVGARAREERLPAPARGAGKPGLRTARLAVAVRWPAMADVSVVIPAWRCADYVEAAVRSAQTQTLT